MRAFPALVFCFVCCAGATALAQQTSNLVPPPMPRWQAKIYAHVTARVLAPCCWSQPVQTHQSEAAERVRAEVVGYVRRGDDEKEILDRLAAEYGERILGEPRGVRGTIAFAIPFLARLSHLEGIFDYFRLETGVKLSACNGGISETVAVKTYPL